MSQVENNLEGRDVINESLDKVLDEILSWLDSSIEVAENHLQDRLENGEAESTMLSLSEDGNIQSSVMSIS